MFNQPFLQPGIAPIDTDLCKARGGAYYPGDQSDFFYSGTGTLEGTFKGIAEYCGHSTQGVAVPAGSIAYVETDTFTGTVDGCGSGIGSFTTDLLGVANLAASSQQGVPIHATWQIVAGSGTAGLRGLRSGSITEDATIATTNGMLTSDFQFRGSVECVPPTLNTIVVNAPYTEPASQVDGVQCLGLGQTSPDCRVAYAGASTWSGGTFTADEHFELTGLATPDGKLTFEGAGYMTNATIAGCGTGEPGTFIMDGWGGYIDFARFDPTNNLPGGVGGSAPGFIFWRIRPGSGTGGLTGLVSGEGVNFWRIYNQGTAGAGGPEGIGLFTGTITCRA
jgi:hypothetical protein